MQILAAIGAVVVACLIGIGVTAYARSITTTSTRRKRK
jgi:hypothetical protein